MFNANDTATNNTKKKEFKGNYKISDFNINSLQDKGFKLKLRTAPDGDLSIKILLTFNDSLQNALCVTNK